MRKGPGRPLGSPNKVNADIRSMILTALHDVGGAKYLAKRAIDTPGPFLALVGKILPTSIVNPDGSAISLHLIAAQLISQELLQQTLERTNGASTPLTLNGHAEAPTGNLLDQPPPTE